MKKAISTMIPGFHSVGLSQHPIFVAISKVAGAGYKAIELNAETLPWAKAHVTPQTPSTERASIVAEADRVGLSISAISAHVPMVEADPACRRAGDSGARAQHPAAAAGKQDADAKTLPPIRGA